MTDDPAVPSVPLGIIEGFLPPVLLAVLFALLPVILRCTHFTWLHILYRSHSRSLGLVFLPPALFSDLDERVQALLCLPGDVSMTLSIPVSVNLTGLHSHGFLIVTLSAGIVNAIKDVSGDCRSSR